MKNLTVCVFWASLYMFGYADVCLSDDITVQPTRGMRGSFSLIAMLPHSQTTVVIVLFVSFSFSLSFLWTKYFFLWKRKDNLKRKEKRQGLNVEVSGHITGPDKPNWREKMKRLRVEYISYYTSRHGFARTQLCPPTFISSWRVLYIIYCTVHSVYCIGYLFLWVVSFISFFHFVAVVLVLFSISIKLFFSRRVRGEEDECTRRAITRFTGFYRSSRWCKTETEGRPKRVIIWKSKISSLSHNCINIKYKDAGAIQEITQTTTNNNQKDKKKRKSEQNKLLDHSLGSRDLSRTGYDIKDQKRKKSKENGGKNKILSISQPWAHRLYSRRHSKCTARWWWSERDKFLYLERQTEMKRLAHNRMEKGIQYLF